MALTTVSAGNIVTQWDGDFFSEYVRGNRFKRYMGTDENSIIQLVEDLAVKKGGSVILSLVAKLTGAGQTGNGLLEGNEEALANYDFEIAVDTLRHAVAVTDHEQQLTEIELRAAAKTMLKLWAMEKLRDGLVTALGSIDGVAYGSASAAQKNTWTVNNADRVLFGNSTANYNATHATALDALDVTNDKCTRDTLELLRDIAETSDPLVRPVSVGEDEETYVAFTGSKNFRNLKADLETVHKDAMERGKSNPLFRDGDLMYDGIIIRKIPEIGVLSNVGSTATVDGQPIYLCGAQALAVAWAKRTKSTTDTRDYGFVKGVGIHEMRGIEKCRFNNKDHGIVTGFCAVE